MDHAAELAAAEEELASATTQRRWLLRACPLIALVGIGLWFVDKRFFALAESLALFLSIGAAYIGGLNVASAEARVKALRQNG